MVLMYVIEQIFVFEINFLMEQEQVTIFFVLKNAMHLRSDSLFSREITLLSIKSYFEECDSLEIAGRSLITKNCFPWFRVIV